MERLFLLCRPLFLWEIPGGQAGRTAKKGKEGQKVVFCHSPTFQGPVALAVAAARCNAEELKTKMMSLLLARGHWGRRRWK